MGPDGQPADRLRARGEVTPGTLMASQRGNKGGGNLLLVLDEGAKHGAPKVWRVLCSCWMETIHFSAIHIAILTRAPSTQHRRYDLWCFSSDLLDGMVHLWH